MSKTTMEFRRRPEGPKSYQGLQLVMLDSEGAVIWEAPDCLSEVIADIRRLERCRVLLEL